VSSNYVYNCSDTVRHPNVNSTAFPPTSFRYSCICNDGYAWKNATKNGTLTSDGSCLQCSTLSIEIAETGHYNGVCACKRAPFYWDKSTISCRVNCTLVENSTGISISSTKCECNLGYRWIDFPYDITATCATLDCSNVSYTDGNNTNAAIGVCTCSDTAKTSWNIMATLC
jgi:hypothetical protein